MAIDSVVLGAFQIGLSDIKDTFSELISIAIPLLVTVLVIRAVPSLIKNSVDTVVSSERRPPPQGFDTWTAYERAERKLARRKYGKNGGNW